MATNLSAIGEAHATSLPNGAEGDRDPFVHYRLVGNVFALLVLLASGCELWRNFVHPGDRDFLGVWSAAKLALAGQPSAAYDNSLLHALEASAATFSNPGAQLPFPYPPAYMAFAAPFGLLSFPAALIVWVIVTFAFYMFAARRLLPGSGWLAAAFPAVFANAAIGQNGFLTAGLFMTGLSLLSASPFTAGAVLGCLVIKPQLGILLPVALLAGRNWRAIAGATLSATGIILAGIFVFGTATTIAWMGEAPLIANVTSAGLMGWVKLASVYAAARQIGLPPQTALAIHGIVAVAAAVMVWNVWRSTRDEGLKIATLAAGSTLMSPYVFYYDALILAPAFFSLARDASARGKLIALWGLSLVLLVQASGTGGFVNLNALVPIALLAVAWRQMHLTKDAAAPTHLTFRQPSGVRISQRVGS
jgi:hypothetical protein